MFRVVIADDEPIVRKGLQFLINWEQMGCQIAYVAENGRDLIDSIKDANPDIIITDIQMPDIDGIRVAQYIHDNGLDVKLIFLTAYADFSYAKAALEYGVVDYVIKNGAFDGLEKALDRAKQTLLEERRQRKNESRGNIIENLLKSIIDGSVYSEDEINARAASIQIELTSFWVLLFYFRMDGTLPLEHKERIHNCLINFFGMAFHEHQSYIVSVKHNLFCLVLDHISPECENEIKDCCHEIISIVQDFMQLDVFVGLSELTSDILNLKAAYVQAESAISNHSFSNETARFFQYKKTESEWNRASLDECNEITEDLCDYIRRGDSDNALTAFLKLLDKQIESRFPFSEIKSSGVFLAGYCRKYLAEHNTLLSDVIGETAETSKIISDSIAADDYRSTMLKLIKAVAERIQQASNKRNMLIYECDRLIDCNIEKTPGKDFLNVTGISEQLGVNASYLSRIYKEKTGITIITVINEKKLARARELMETTDLRIYEIADILGFENITYFSHFFKKHIGVSPAAYKKQFEENGYRMKENNSAN